MQNKYSYHDRVLSSRAKYNIVRAARGTGKTYLALNWILQKPDEKVLFFTSAGNREFNLHVQRLKELHPDLVKVHNSSHVVLANGTTIWFADRENLRTIGRNVTKVVIDDAGYIKGDNIHAVIAQQMDRGAKLLALTSEVMKGSIFEDYERNKLTDAYYEEYSVEDALREEIYDDVFVNQMMDNRSEKRFRAEFGPWGTISKFEKRNKDYKHLLVRE